MSPETHALEVNVLTPRNALIALFCTVDNFGYFAYPQTPEQYINIGRIQVLYNLVNVRYPRFVVLCLLINAPSARVPDCAKVLVHSEKSRNSSIIIRKYLHVGAILIGSFPITKLKQDLFIFFGL
jgi:hypothetical protein